jgi:hypothetical protein
VKRPATWLSRQGATASLKRSDTAMSNQGQDPHLRIHVFANVGDQDNLITVKVFATTKEASVWIEQQRLERPGHYHIASEDEFDACA